MQRSVDNAGKTGRFPRTPQRKGIRSMSLTYGSALRRTALFAAFWGLSGSFVRANDNPFADNALPIVPPIVNSTSATEAAALDRHLVNGNTSTIARVHIQDCQPCPAVQPCPPTPGESSIPPGPLTAPSQQAPNVPAPSGQLPPELPAAQAPSAFQTALNTGSSEPGLGFGNAPSMLGDFFSGHPTTPVNLQSAVSAYNYQFTFIPVNLPPTTAGSSNPYIFTTNATGSINGTGVSYPALTLLTIAPSGAINLPLLTSQPANISYAASGLPNPSHTNTAVFAYAPQIINGPYVNVLIDPSSLTALETAATKVGALSTTPLSSCNQRQRIYDISPTGRLCFRRNLHHAVDDSDISSRQPAIAKHDLCDTEWHIHPRLQDPTSRCCNGWNDQAWRQHIANSTGSNHLRL